MRPEDSTEARCPPRETTGAYGHDPLSTRVVRPPWTPHVKVFRWRCLVDRLPHQLPTRFVATGPTPGDERIRYRGRGQASSTHHTVRAARRFIETNFERSIGLAEIAAAAGRDRFHVIRAFRKILGVTPYAYLILWRMAQARELLRDGMRPAEVSLAVGLCDQAHLNRYFRRVFGMTPGQYQGTRTM